MADVKERPRDWGALGGWVGKKEKEAARCLWQQAGASAAALSAIREAAAKHAAKHRRTGRSVLRYRYRVQAPGFLWPCRPPSAAASGAVSLSAPVRWRRIPLRPVIGADPRDPGR